jgi:hypothetical protein
LRRSSSGAHNRWRPAKGSSISDSTPNARMTRQPSAGSAAYSKSAVFPIPASPRSTNTALRAASITRARAGKEPSVARMELGRSRGRARGQNTRERQKDPRSRARLVVPERLARASSGGERSRRRRESGTSPVGLAGNVVVDPLEADASRAATRLAGSCLIDSRGSTRSPAGRASAAARSRCSVP